MRDGSENNDAKFKFPSSVIFIQSFLSNIIIYTE